MGGIAIYSFLANVTSMLGVLLSAFYVFTKAIKYKPAAIHKMLFSFWCLLWAFLYAVNPSWMPPVMANSILCLTSILFIWAVTKEELDTVISAFMLSFGVSYVLYFIASFIIGLAFMPFVSGDYMPGTMINHDTLFNLLFYSFVAAVQLLLSFLLFRIRRFKNGFPFLLKKHAIIAVLIFSGVVLIFATWIRVITASEYAYTAYLYMAGILTIGAGIYIWIKRGIRMFYRRGQEERAIEILEQQLSEAKDENQRLAVQNDALRVANHKTQHRLATLERAVFSMARGSPDDGGDLYATLEDVRRAARDYRADVGRMGGKPGLPSTKIKMLDDLFGEFCSRFADNRIDFKLKVNGSIPYMVEKVIGQGELETMIGDHLQNALIAVNASGGALRSVWAILGLAGAGDCYAFTVYDSGIPFETGTLARLGAERVTTHADDGGSGIGFMTTFEAMRECKASLIINEKPPSGSDYTKSVTVRFDGESRYIIETYRPGEFPESDRFIVGG